MHTAPVPSPAQALSLKDLALPEGLAERLYWLIRLRWFAVAGVCFTALLADKALHVPLNYAPIYAIAATLAIYNLLFFIYLNWKDARTPRAIGVYNCFLLLSPNRPEPADRSDLPLIANRLANAQISLDLLTLSALIHFSGGMENPFAYYFIFHMIIAGILLSRRASYLQAALASALFLLVAAMEEFGLWEHNCLYGASSCCLGAGPLPLAGSSAAFVSTLFLAVYMATSISLKLRRQEATLAEANLRLEEKDRIKSNYVLRVSHDIKEHLAAIQSCLDPVLHGMLGPVAPEQERMIRRSYDRTDKLLVFVKALLEITRIKLSKTIETGPFSLRKAAENAVNFVEEQARTKNIKLTWTVAPGVEEITGAQVYIEETIACLLANSIKYTPEGGSVDLLIGDAGTSVLIQVSDTGIGIPKDELGHIFEEFYRAKNAKAIERTGTGLGLCMAKEVAERHNGCVWVESEEGKGSKFYLSLPKYAGAPHYWSGAGGK